jgi:hypothetical protein
MKYRKFDENAKDRGISLYDRLVEQYDSDTLEVLTYMLFNDMITMAFTEPLYEPLKELVEVHDQCETVMNAIKQLQDVT